MIYLDTKTDYSFRRAYMKPDQAAERVAALGHRGFGVADYCSTWGHIPLHKAARKAGVEIALGVTLPVVDADENDLPKDPLHDLVAVYGAGREGLSSLYRLVSKAHQQAYYRPRVTWDQLRDPTFRVVVYKASIDAEPIIKELGAYVALRPGTSRLQRVALDGELPLCLAPSPSYARPEDRPGYETMMRASDINRLGEAHKKIEGLGMVPEATLRGMLDVPEDVFNGAAQVAEEIFDACRIENFPRATLPDAGGWDIRRAVREGAALRGIDLNDDRYRERVERELRVVEDKGFVPYFAFVSSIVAWAKSSEGGAMLVGPGRGSAGGCLVAYLLGITAVDPIVHGTLFERFIDPSRPDMPDIDVDFQDDRRELVFEELRRRYGADHVARIGTVSFLGGKSAINEVARFERHVPFADRRVLGERSDALDVPLAQLFLTDDATKAVLERHPCMRAAALIDGHARHSGVHAAGVCVSTEPATMFGSVDQHGTIALTLDDADEVGLLKFDALGLTTLSVIAAACEHAGIDPYSLETLPLDDDRVFQVFRDDLVTGVFQFEGHTVRGLMREVHVDRFSDLPALCSLARPGPLQGGAAEAWVKRRAGNVDWQYQHPLLEPITKDTYGMLVYQEQMMHVGREIAGFDDGQVNRMRKAVGKKNPVALQAMREEFVAGASRSVGDEMAEALWQQLCDFGGYAFNLSHAVAYSLVSYACAYLKAYYPEAFALGLLRNCGDNDRAKIVLRELQSDGMKFVPFDVALSEKSWSIKDGVLYGGYTGITGIGDKMADTLLKARGEAESIEAFLAGLTPKRRMKLLDGALNTPWNDIDVIGRRFRHIFEDPWETHKIKGRVYRLDEIPHRKGSYVTIGKLHKVMPQDQNDAARIAKRGGREVSGPTRFVNLIWSDDGNEIGSTINRFKFEDIGAELVEDPNAVGKHYLIRGDVLGGDGPRWLMIDKLKLLDVPSDNADEELPT